MRRGLRRSRAVGGAVTEIEPRHGTAENTRENGAAEAQAVAQVSLTPHQAKLVMADAVLRLPEVVRARAEGVIALHPSTSTLPIARALLGAEPGGMPALGMVRPKGLCLSLERQEAARTGDRLGRPPSGFPHTWVIERGRLREPAPLQDILAGMGPGDVYVKGCNALDAAGNAGVLYASPRAGTIGLVIAARSRRRFTIVAPVGLEKLIPGEIGEAARAARPGRITLATGQKCGVIPVPGAVVVTEATALETLFGVRCSVIAAGGVAGGEGSTVIVMEGRRRDVEAAFDYVRGVKRVPPPVYSDTECEGCPIDRCLMPERKAGAITGGRTGSQRQFPPP